MASLSELSKSLESAHQSNKNIVVGDIPIFFNPGQLTILGGRPGMGKTLLMLYFFYHLLDKYDESSYFFSNEEDKESLYLKLIATVSQTELSRIKIIRETALRVYPNLSSKNCHINNFACSWEDLKKYLLEILGYSSIFNLFIDKIQGLYSEKTFFNRDQELSYIIRELKTFAVRYNISVIVSTSLSRGLENQLYKKPSLKHLKDSGAMEDIADLIILLFRPEYYGITEDDEGNNIKGDTELIISKSRNSLPETIHLFFNKKIPCFKDYSEFDKFFSIKKAIINSYLDDHPDLLI